MNSKKEYKLMAIDESTKKTGCALFSNGELISYCVLDTSKNKDSASRLHEMCALLLQQMKNWGPDEIYIEHPQGYGRNVLTVWMLSQIIGVARAYAIEHDCPISELTPSEWRSYLNFKQGKTKRDELKRMSIGYVKENYGLEVTDDAADAICIGTAILRKFDEGDK